MALSNWDTFAMNEKGEPCKGEFISPLGVRVTIYKNWVYVYDEVAWQENIKCHQKPCVMEIFKSEMQYKDVVIVSDFIDNTIYLAVFSYTEPLTGMVGVGSYGFDDDGKYVGVTKTHLRKLKDFLETETNYFSIPVELKELSLKDGNRFNQGDMFFHEKLGIDKQCSVPGKAEEPILMKMLKPKGEDENVSKSV